MRLGRIASAIRAKWLGSVLSIRENMQHKQKSQPGIRTNVHHARSPRLLRGKFAFKRPLYLLEPNAPA